MEIKKIILEMDNHLCIEVRRNRSLSVSCTISYEGELKEAMEKLKGEETQEKKEEMRRHEEAIRQIEEEIWKEIEAMAITPIDPLGNPVTRDEHHIQWDYCNLGKTDPRTGLEVFSIFPYIEPIKSEYDRE